MSNFTDRKPDRKAIQKACARWAPIYYIVCGPIFLDGRRAAARAARDVGGLILEIGVGIGLSFDDYDNSTEVVGIDLSGLMVARAEARLANGQYPYVKKVAQMDAANLDFPDQSFDCVVGQFVIALAANPERVLSECARVLKPGGQIILVNHFYLETGTAAAIERWASHHAQPLGLRPHFSLTRLRAWAQNHQDVTMLGQHKVPPLGVYTLTRFGRNSSAAHDPAFSAAT